MADERIPPTEVKRSTTWETAQGTKATPSQAQLKGSYANIRGIELPMTIEELGEHPELQKQFRLLNYKQDTGWLINDAEIADLKNQMILKRGAAQQQSIDQFQRSTPPPATNTGSTAKVQLNGRTFNITVAELEANPALKTAYNNLKSDLGFGMGSLDDFDAKVNAHTQILRPAQAASTNANTVLGNNVSIGNRVFNITQKELNNNPQLNDKFKALQQDMSFNYGDPEAFDQEIASARRNTPLSGRTPTNTTTSPAAPILRDQKVLYAKLAEQEALATKQQNQAIYRKTVIEDKKFVTADGKVHKPSDFLGTAEFDDIVNQTKQMKTLTGHELIEAQMNRSKAVRTAQAGTPQAVKDYWLNKKNNIVINGEQTKVNMASLAKEPQATEIYHLDKQIEGMKGTTDNALKTQRIDLVNQRNALITEALDKNTTSQSWWRGRGSSGRRAGTIAGDRIASITDGAKDTAAGWFKGLKNFEDQLNEVGKHAANPKSRGYTKAVAALGKNEWLKPLHHVTGWFSKIDPKIADNLGKVGKFFGPALNVIFIGGSIINGDFKNLAGDLFGLGAGAVVGMLMASTATGLLPLLAAAVVSFGVTWLASQVGKGLAGMLGIQNHDERQMSQMQNDLLQRQQAQQMGGMASQDNAFMTGF